MPHKYTKIGTGNAFRNEGNEGNRPPYSGNKFELDKSPIKQTSDNKYDLKDIIYKELNNIFSIIEFWFIKVIS